MATKTAVHPLVRALRGHFYLDAPLKDEEAACAVADEALHAVGERLSEGDLQTVASALMDDVVMTDGGDGGGGAHRLVWRGMSRVFAMAGESERFITADIDERLARVREIVGDALEALALLERGRHARFIALPEVVSDDVLRDGAGGDGRGASLVIEGDNLKALRYLTPDYAGTVDLIYADPPYNSGERLFRYRDRFSPEAWLTMMRDRLAMLAPMLKPTGAAAFSINEAYGSELKLLCDEALGRENFLTALTIRVRHEDRILKGARAYQDVTEQVLLYRASAEFVPPRRTRAARDHEYEWGVSLTGGAERDETIDGKRVEFYAPGSFALTRGHAPGGLKRINIRGALRESNSSGRFYVAHLERHFKTRRGWLMRVEDIGADGLGYRDFVIPPDGRRRNADYLQGRPVDSKGVREFPHANYKDFERDFNRVAGEDGASFRNGKKPVSLLRHIMTLTGIDENPDALVLDPFAGSGTTAASVIGLNQEDAGGRRFITIDKGEHLRTVVVPRVERLLDAGDGRHGVRVLTLRSASVV